MYESAARNLRTTERFLIDPPLSAQFGSSVVFVCDISLKGARFTHAHPLEMGSKSILRMVVEGRPSPVALEAVIVWTQPEGTSAGKFVSGARTYAAPEHVALLLRTLHAAGRTTRIEELRGSDRFFLKPNLAARWNSERVTVEDLCARGARIGVAQKLDAGTAGVLRLEEPVDVEVKTHVVWSSVEAVDPLKHRAGLAIENKGEQVRLAIGRLSESGRATLDTQSLGLKLKIIRARARQMAPSHRDVESSGVPAEQYILVQCVREELRLNPEEAMHWYRKARLLIKDPKTKSTAPAIADHPDALAVWEYLDRSVDPSIIGRMFQLPSGKSM
ncbi:MAG TPA: PilZ domain-containing protein [Thermoanaerobaculia bacterium]|nr:PilZ domain-containing protein [Thermoanaerobaculia bacterium]